MDNAYNPSGHFDSYTVSGGVVTMISPIVSAYPLSSYAPYAVNNSAQVVGWASLGNLSGSSVSGAFIDTPGHGSMFIANNAWVEPSSSLGTCSGMLELGMREG